MNSLDQLEQKLRELCPQLPHWQQLLLQGFWYGLMSWLITCSEDGYDIEKQNFTLKDVVKHADPTFESWPADWLETEFKAVLALKLTHEDLNALFLRIDTVFRDCIPTDLDIFSTLAEGETLTEEQWERLYDAMAFLPPNTSGIKKSHPRGKTRRVRGRRAITPMRRHHHHRAITHHRSHLNVVKMK